MIVSVVEPLYSDWGEYRLLVHNDWRVDVEIDGVIRGTSVTARRGRLIGDLYREGVIQAAFEEAKREG